MQRFVARAGGLVLGIGLLLLARPAPALITRLTPLNDVLREYPFIFTVKVEKLAPEKPAAVLVVDEDLKDKAPFRKLAVNFKGDSDAQKEGQTPQLLKRLAPDLPLVVFAKPQGKVVLAFAYSNGTWFQMVGRKDADSDAVHWGFTHCEPYLRRTFKDGTTDLRQTVLDVLANRKAAPGPDPKAEPGLGPEVQPGAAPAGRKPGQVHVASGPLFAVIPTVLVAGPLAILALMFPAVFGGLTLVFRRWLVVLSIISLDSTLWILQGWLSPWIGQTWWGNSAALWVALTVIAVAALLWSWHRHAAAIREEALPAPQGDPPAVAAGPVAAPASPAAASSFCLPRRGETIALGTLSLLGLAVVAWCLLRRVPLLDDSWRKPLLVLCLSVWAGTLYTVYLRRRGASRLAALPAEGIMLAAMASAGIALGLTTLPRQAAAREIATSVEEAVAGEGAKPATLVWKFEAKDPGSIASSPLVAGERVYIAAAHGSLAAYGRLYCLDRATGKEVWSFDNDGEMKEVFSTPCLADGRLYIGEGFHQDKNCKLYCLDAATGKKQWEFATSSHTESSPCVAGGKVYFGAGDDGAFCVDAATGKEVWHYPGLHVDCSPCVIGNRLFAGSGIGDVYRDTYLFCLDAETGGEVWKMPADLPAWGSPAVSGKQAFFGLGNGNFVQSDDRPAGAVLCVEAETGRRLWHCDVPDAVLNRPALDRHRVCFGARDHFCYCLDRRDGTLRWKRDMGSPVVTAPALARSPGSAAGTSIYVLGSAGRVCCFDPESGAVDWTVDVAATERAQAQMFSSPAVTIGRTPAGERRQLYFGAGLTTPLGTTAVLYCYEDHIED